MPPGFAALARPLGRRRLFTAGVILEAAAKAGIMGLTMKARADPLGIGVATLFG